MSVNSVQQFLNVRDSHLRVVSGNVHADQMVIGGITVDTSHGLQSVTDTSNVTTNTIEFSNATTAFVTTANATIGGILNVDTPTTLGGDLTVSGNTFYSNNTSINIDSNVVAEFTGPHTRLPKEIPLKKYPEIAFISNEGVGGTYDRYLSSSSPFDGIFIQAGYVVSSSSNFSASVNQGAWNLFAHRNSEPGDNYSWYSENATNYNGTNGGSYSYSGDKNLGTGAVNGEWVKIEMPEKIRLKNYILWGADLESEFPQDWTLYGSNNGTSWSSIHSKNGQTIGSGAWSTTANSATGKFVNLDVTSSDYYKYFALVFTRAGARNDYVGIGEWELYGYEEDPPAGDISVDTTFKSILNTPQTTRANVYVDAKLSSDFTNHVTGPTPVGTTATHDNTNKYWEMNGQLTSNITVEANTFLEGDQPHAVSVWFNSSNLEANVSNTCVFSVSDQEHLNSQNLDLQSNTWHNLTYSYQGEGGSRVTYLDGRKVAEDQAEDTFGDYPPFAMTGYSQGGYVVSVSSTHLESVYRPFYAFNDIITDVNHVWHSDTSSYTGTSNQYNGTERLAANVDPGDWIKLETPHKIKVSYINITARPPDAVAGNLENQAPKDFQVCGSNDDVNWDVLASFTGEAPQDDGSSYYIVNAQRGYKYLAIAVNKTVGSASLTISNIKYYGHRENDMVRLPDPTNVLKYPHVAMSEYAKRGYVIEASSYYDDGSTQYYPYHAFNEKITLTGNEPVEHVWTSATADYPSSGGNYISTTYGIGTTYGEFLKLTLPHKLKLTKARIYPRTYSPPIGNNQSPAQFKIFGSNDNFSSEIVELYHQNTDWVNNGTWGDFTISTTSYFKHFGIVFTKTNGTNILGIQALEYFGTEENSSIPIQIGGGNIDRVANFRVYDKFIDENQALEIWNAQKEEFGRAKPQMVLQQGKLGIGTDAPQGSLSVADEPHNLEEFPPRAMTDYKNYFEGHGEFCASASSEYYASGATVTTYVAYQAFDRKNKNAGNGWSEITWNSVSPSYDTSTGIVSTGASLGGYAGEWLKLSLPYGVKISGYQLAIRSAWVNYGPDNWVILGSNDDKNWDLVSSVTTGRIAQGNNGDQVMTKDFTVETTKYYKYLALVCSKVAGLVNQVNFAELRYFGTREQGQSILHDGQLTLTKSLNVPRIGPAPDVDDTPRRDRLVVEYNTSTNPTFEGAVRDTSGRRLDGILKGSSALYDTNEKSLKVTTAGDAIKSFPLNNPAGAYPNSFSFWFKTNGTTGRTICVIGDDSGNDSHGIHINNAGKINQYHFSNDKNYDEDIRHGQWYHIVATYDGGSVATSRRLWLNGKELTAYTITGTLGAPNIPANTTLFVCSRAYDTTVFDGSVSNFKLYDVALTAEEAKTLYDMGRCDEGHHVVNFSKTRIGIGLGDGEAPQATLDVRGDIRYINIAPIALPTFYDHILAGRSDRGIYPIVGTQGGTKIYNVYCEPDMFGGGWMCFAQVPQEGPSSDAWNLYTDEKGNSNIFLSPQNSTTRRHAMFSVPMNILSSNNGVNLDVLLMVYGNALRNNGTFGAKVGAIWRGVNLNIAFDSAAIGSVGTDSNQARSSNGVDFTASSKALYKGNTGWDFSICVNGEGVDGGYGDTNDGTAGYIVHEVPGGWNLYCDAIVGPGGTWQYVDNPNWEYVRFFVRPSSF